MNTLADLNIKIIRLKKLRFDVAHQKGILEVMEGELDNVKQEILDTLKEAKALSYKTETGTASINRRQTVKITDESKVESWMIDNGLDASNYTKLDTTRLKPLLEEAVFRQGEVIDGTEVATTEYISLREPTKQ